MHLYVFWVYWATPGFCCCCCCFVLLLWATWLDAMESKTVWLAPQDAFPHIHTRTHRIKTNNNSIWAHCLNRASFVFVFIFTTVFVKHTFQRCYGSISTKPERKNNFFSSSVFRYCSLLVDTTAICAAFYLIKKFGNFYTSAWIMIYLAFPSCNAMKMLSRWMKQKWERDWEIEWGRGRNREKDHQKLSLCYTDTIKCGILTNWLSAYM